MSKHQPEKDITVLGKVYRVKFSLRVLSKIEEILKENPLKENFWIEFSPRKILVLVFALICQHEPKLTLDQLGESIGISDLSEIGEAIRVLFSDAQPEPEHLAKDDSITVNPDGSLSKNDQS